jgi:putative tricarboxylic transport membrane protein
LAGKQTGPLNEHLGHKRLADRVSAILWVLVGIVAISQSLKIDLMAEFGPGPGFLPFWLGVGIILLGVTLLAQTLFRRREEETLPLPRRPAVRQMFLVMMGVFGFAFLVERVGFVICVGLLLLFLLVLVERRLWKQSLLIAGVGALLFWAIFELGLQLRLPPGLLKLL